MAAIGVVLNFHLQSAPDLKAGEGLPAFLNNYIADGTAVGHGEPARGETVSPAS